MQPQAWIHLLDTSVATAIAAGFGYLLLRWFERTEAARRTQMEGFVTKLIEQVIARLETKIDLLKK